MMGVTGLAAALKPAGRVRWPGVAEAACWLTAAALVAAAVAWPGVAQAPDRGAAEQDAAAVLRRVAAAERSFVETEHRYRPIGPQAAAAALDLPGYEAPARAVRFLVDAAPGEDGSLVLRAVTRPDAVGEGVAAVVVRQTLPPPAGADAVPTPRLSASAVP